MNARERLVVAVHEKQQLEQSMQQPEDPEPERSKKRALIVKGPDLPMEIAMQPHSLTAVPAAGPAAPPAPRITNVEDLFEETGGPGEGETGDLPSVSIIREPSGDVGGDEDEPAATGTEFSTILSDPENVEQEPDDDEGTEGEIASEEQPSPPLPNPAVRSPRQPHLTGHNGLIS